jgi:hypothetical protein
MNENWGRWIRASVVNHFMGLRQNIALYLDRYDRDTDWAELRYGGPYIDELSKGCFLLTVNVDIMITCFPGRDQYKMDRMTGIFSAAFTPICCRRYGDGIVDDQSFLGDLYLSTGRVNITNFGLVLPDNKFQRSTVEADYIMYLYGS